MRTILLLGVFLCTQAFAETLEGRVVGVTDGDTITLLDGSRQRHKIRIAGIDAPERKQPFGSRSKQHRLSSSGPRKRSRHNHELKLLSTSRQIQPLAKRPLPLAWLYDPNWDDDERLSSTHS
jgi:hypothetical protein